MRAFEWITTAVLAFFVAGYASSETPSAEARRELAPGGKLRVAFLGTAPIHAIKDAATGELKGPAVDLGREIARRIGVPFEPVAYSSLAPLLAGAAAGEWDIGMMGVSSERARAVDFSPPYMVVEFSYLVPSGSSIATLADVDRPGIRVAVLEKSSPEAHLSRTLRNAALVRFPTLAETVQSLQLGKADAAYATRASMISQSARLTNSRVLEGNSGGEETAIAVPKGRPLATAYVRQFVSAVKAEGQVGAAIEKAGLRGVIVAPPH